MTWLKLRKFRCRQFGKLNHPSRTMQLRRQGRSTVLELRKVSINWISWKQKLLMPRACSVSNSPFLRHLKIHSWNNPRKLQLCLQWHNGMSNNKKRSDGGFIIKLFVVFGAAGDVVLVYTFCYRKTFGIVKRNEHGADIWMEKEETPF